MIRSFGSIALLLLLAAPLAPAAPALGCGEVLSGEWKIIRDLLPGIFRAEGDTAQTRDLSPVEARIFMIAKMREELAEFEKTPNNEEMADILEVAHGMMTHFALDPALVEKTRLDKRLKKGGFDRAVAMKICK